MKKQMFEEHIYGEVDRLGCLLQMAKYYQYIYESIKYLLGQEKPIRMPSTVSSKIKRSVGNPKKSDFDYKFTRMSRELVLECRRYINSDLHNLSVEFYLQRVEWANKCRKEKLNSDHQRKAKENPALHPCQMRGGFKRIVDCEDEAKIDQAYTYEEFLGETQPIFIAIHSHLVSINRVLGDLYHHVTETPFSAFTSSGKSEILHLTSELNRIMRGLLVATHLQPQAEWQYDLISYLITCRADCLRFFETIPRYYQTHRMRLIVFSDDTLQGDGASEVYPLSCLPWAAGTYLDFLMAYQSLALHTLAVLHWSIRLYSRWYLVPKRYLNLVSPTFIGGRQ